MSAQETNFASPQFSSKGAVASKEPPLDLRLNSNLEVEIANQALVNGDITLSLLYVPFNRVLERNQPDYWARSEMHPPCVSCFRGGDEL
ncbi:uncharacterized protein ARMOST_11290 [Armillaria ostoyae]|uniref:Uncharacterized protein n=2 Tax=Armillaria TaxID=47424 RepID=A0A284RGR3_ARMOS|nr:hypothetical protein ARMSODRAFT_1014208 [Armillaria solidipes]SJL07932.1 uncharacterized protein ARMOST_11290 [Armillaria ostoyae]